MEKKAKRISISVRKKMGLFSENGSIRTRYDDNVSEEKGVQNTNYYRSGGRAKSTSSLDVI